MIGMATRSQFIAAARTYIGTPWRHQGRDRHGLDCVGLIVAAAAEIGIVANDIPNYRRANRGKFFDAVLAHTKALTELPRSGDLVVMRDHIAPIHIGILCIEDGRRTLIHAATRRRSVIEEVVTPELNAEIVAYRSFDGLED